MNIRHPLLALLLALLPAAATAAPQSDAPQKTFKLRIALTDKKDCGFSTRRPEAFLTAKSIDRRKRYGLKVDEHDLPLTPAYVGRILQMGLTEVCRSKWVNTLVVAAPDTLVMERLRALPFVSSVRCVWETPDAPEPEAENANRAEEIVLTKADTLASFYGHARQQVEMLGVERLHNAGLRGAGVTIAVVDGGFHNADLIPGLPHERILGTRNFVRPDRSVYAEQSHGMMVLSCIAANVPHALVGTAPDASFYLMVSEDNESEQMVEEDYWCAAVEAADSLGCDMVTSSLGYTGFDHAYMPLTYRELDGRTHLISRVASLAASRGMLVLNSAGNSGNDTWKKIGVPADGTDMLAVGAVDADSINTRFSSLGHSADGRVKPDVMAMGQQSAVFGIDSQVTFANGTSFSCPIMCGAVACLVGAHPGARPTDIIDAVRRAGNNARHPDNIFGYGIPYMPRANEMLSK